MHRQATRASIVRVTTEDDSRLPRLKLERLLGPESRLPRRNRVYNGVSSLGGSRIKKLSATTGSPRGVEEQKSIGSRRHYRLKWRFLGLTRTVTQVRGCRHPPAKVTKLLTATIAGPVREGIGGSPRVRVVSGEEPKQNVHKN